MYYVPWVAGGGVDDPMVKSKTDYAHFNVNQPTGLWPAGPWVHTNSLYIVISHLFHTFRPPKILQNFHKINFK